MCPVQDPLPAARSSTSLPTLPFVYFKFTCALTAYYGLYLDVPPKSHVLMDFWRWLDLECDAETKGVWYGTNPLNHFCLDMGMDNGSPTLGVGNTTQKDCSLAGIKRKEKLVACDLLPSACYAMNCFSPVTLLCHANSPCNPLTMDWNIYKLWAEI